MKPTTLVPGRRIVHATRGAGTVKLCWPDRLVCVCQFDDGDGIPELVQVRDLVPEPGDMPPRRPDLRIVPPVVA